VGFVHDDEPIGVWFVKEIDGIEYDFFGICHVDEVKKTSLPKRLYAYLALKKFINIICISRLENIFTQTPEFVFVLAKHKWKNFCFCFAGLGNAVGLSKIRFLRIFGSIYERRLFNNLKKSATKILAASDMNTIEKKIRKFNYPQYHILPFPTRFDDEIFNLKNRNDCREQLAISLIAKVFITTGRLASIKGWKFLLDSFRLVNIKFPESIIIFVGEGEDKSKIITYCKTLFDDGKVWITGYKSPQEVSVYLNAADVFVLGSFVEGWPTSMVEALACGRPIVSTDVSGAIEMINIGLNGYITKNRDSIEFSNLLIKALSLPCPNHISIKNSLKYSLKNLKADFEKVWLNEIN
jgi:glycosyltransferase involved in cell wall biosynthesis